MGEDRNGKRTRKNDGSKLEAVSNHVWIRLITQIAVIAGVPLVVWSLDRFAEQVDMNSRSARGLSDSQIVLVQQQKQLVQTFEGFKKTQDEIKEDVSGINDRVIRLETREEMRE